MLGVLTYLFYLLSKPNIPIQQICAAKVRQKKHICKKRTKIVVILCKSMKKEEQYTKKIINN